MMVGRDVDWCRRADDFAVSVLSASVHRLTAVVRQHRVRARRGARREHRPVRGRAGSGGMVMDAQLAGAIGAGVTFVATTTYNWFVRRAATRREDAQAAERDAREDRQRWHRERLAAYTTVWIRLSTVQEVFESAARSVQSPLFRFQPWAPYRLMRRLVSADVALREAGAALTTIRFIAGGEVVEAADRCATALGELNVAYGEQQHHRIDELLSEMNNARHEFLTKARNELDVEQSAPQPPSPTPA